ncbi:helix-turn-helix domain-containing protein [Streptomyces sp. NPDC056437]|uniref:helix-turn-helix domain-containing protein n=1 Tax=Streptomyces sp. NPDC056437 TaxID=3345816 RepID=UPI0036B77032
MPADQTDRINSARVALGRQLRALRLDANLTQERLAERSGLDRSTIQRIEGGYNDPKFSHLFVLADALKVPLRDLMPRS